MSVKYRAHSGLPANQELELAHDALMRTERIHACVREQAVLEFRCLSLPREQLIESGP